MQNTAGQRLAGWLAGRQEGPWAAAGPPMPPAYASPFSVFLALAASGWCAIFQVMPPAGEGQSGKKPAGGQSITPWVQEQQAEQLQCKAPALQRPSTAQQWAPPTRSPPLTLVFDCLVVHRIQEAVRQHSLVAAAIQPAHTRRQAQARAVDNSDAGCRARFLQTPRERDPAGLVYACLCCCWQGQYACLRT
jgi:hypothetical protein